MRAAAEHLASVTLELGGKSPAVVTQTARVKEAAQRIAVAKFVNVGQTCIAPDYVLVDASVSDAFITALVDEIRSRFAAGGSFQSSASYGRMVNNRQFARVRGLVDEAVAAGATVVLDGPWDESSRFIHPVVLTHVSPGVRLLEEEIFGPVLPVILYNNLEEALRFIQERPNPLALYVFAQRDNVAEQILSRTSSGAPVLTNALYTFYIITFRLVERAQVVSARRMGITVSWRSRTRNRCCTSGMVLLPSACFTHPIRGAQPVLWSGF